MIPLSISISVFLKDFLSMFFRIALSISISIFSRIALSISISISIFSKMTISISISISIFFKSVNISTIDIQYRYIEQGYVASIVIGSGSVGGSKWTVDRSDMILIITYRAEGEERFLTSVTDGWTGHKLDLTHSLVALVLGDAGSLLLF